MKLKIVRYTKDKKADWDAFVHTSKNHFIMFYRDYMDYHSDRFEDSSLMFYRNNKLIALLPAHIMDGVMYSHNGLTLGGFILDFNMGTVLMTLLFNELLYYLKNEGVKKLVYKTIPHIYHFAPAEEDRYSLFLNNAKLIRRDVTSVIYLPDTVSFAKNRLRQVKKAISFNLDIEENEDYATYWSILERNLGDRHSVKPVHTISEIGTLHFKFPDTIRLFTCSFEGTMVAGAVIYESRNVAHAQYIASTEEGRDVAALDYLFSNLIAYYKQKKRYFDFGISNEKDGLYLNNGLISFKEGFGARAVAHDFYALDIT